MAVKEICDRFEYEYDDRYGKGSSGYAFVHAFDDCTISNVRPNVHGKWMISMRGKCADLICPNCRETIIELAYNLPKEEVEEQLVIEMKRTNAFNFCPYCGCDCRETKKGM